MFDKLSPVTKLELKTFLSDPCSVTGAVIVGNRRCSLSTDMLKMDVNIHTEAAGK